jgi:hypothetical protein
MDGDLYVSILDEELQVLIFSTKPRMTLSFNKIMTPSTLAKRPNNGFKIINIKLWTGLHNPQTSIPLNTFGVI